MNNKIKWMVAMSVLFLLDGVATAVFVEKLGIHAEANPIVRGVVTDHGALGLFAMKAAALALYWSSCLLYNRKRGKHFSTIPDKVIFAILVPVCAAGVMMAQA